MIPLFKDLLYSLLRIATDSKTTYTRMGNRNTKPHTIYRSSEMSFYEIIFRHETAFECINILGNQGLVQFEDMNEGHTAFQRRYISQIRRCEEIERHLRYVETEMKNANIKANNHPDMPETPRLKEIGVIELILQKTSSDLKEENNSIDVMKKTLNETKEMKYVLQNVQIFFDDEDPELAYKDFIEELEKRPDFLAEKGFVLPSETQDEDAESHTIITFRKRDADLGCMKVDFMAGVINRAKIHGFERMLWRVSHGNIYVHFYDIKEKLIDHYSGDKILKSVFILFFLGEKLKPLVTKICEGFRGHIYPCPQSFDERRLLTLQANIDIQDLEATISKATVERDRILATVGEQDLGWAIKVRKMKSIYHTMNLLSEGTKTSLVGRCWIPTAEVSAVQEALWEGVQRSGSSVAVLMNQLETTANPPTYNKTNKFTRGFQVLVDAYGVASYQEFNPAPYYIITFPFLFGVMFGDMGHGTIILIFGLFLIWKEKTFMKTREGNEIWKIFFGGRYIIFMMGIFAIYCGFIYNDVFSKSFNIFGSKWSARFATDIKSGETLNRNTSAAELFHLSPFEGGFGYAKKPYIFGLDPIWSISPLKIPFLNSFKMKTSIILGFVQMFGGLLLSLGNFIYFKRQLNIWCEFVPQILFLSCMFGYMVFMIFFKWIAFGPYDDFPRDKSNMCAPLILIRFIDMLMMQTSTPMSGCPAEMFRHQEILQRILLVIIAICVPWMLLTRPLILLCRQRKKKTQNQSEDQKEFAWEIEESEENVENETNLEVNYAQEIGDNIVEDGIKSLDEGGTKSLVEDGIKSLDEGGTKSLDEGGTKSLVEDGIKSLDEGGTKELDEGGTKSLGEGGTKSLVEDGTKQLVGDGTKQLVDKEQGQPLKESLSEEHVVIVPKEKDEEEDGIGEIFIHQGIHTIEFVLGSISHTASYLRLWALSLAHQQLSDVLYVMILQTPMAMDSLHFGILSVGASYYWFALIVFGVVTFCLFAVWSTLTLAILVVMEGLSAFLHTLRLHWVEFQSKFYWGLGHQFSPFSFHVILDVLKTERQT